MDVFTLGSSFFSPPRRPHLPSTSGTDFLEGWCLDRQGKGGIHLPHEKPGGAVHAPLWFSSRQERVSGLSHEGRGEERAYPSKVVDLPRRRNISRSRGPQAGRKRGAPPPRRSSACTVRRISLGTVFGSSSFRLIYFSRRGCPRSIGSPRVDPLTSLSNPRSPPFKLGRNRGCSGSIQVM